MATLLELSKETIELITKLSLEHIKNVEADPEFKTDGDNFDYWGSVKLADNTYIDYNVHESNFGEVNDEPNHWHCCAYAVDKPTEDHPFYQINTSIYAFIFDYINGEITYHDIDEKALVLDQ